ncbi:hypothetical protein OHA77_23515 [Streptosporangium sp. NBC_01639]|uniref:hypothetical protein n=1 Tax=Streptosporangium sp. NBC_01639 TaxID=2975948 RepID=UPI00386CC737|nr:hypothetical protein OHA77_23515 [Streptosporangium sp. NBC_01639]
MEYRQPGASGLKVPALSFGVSDFSGWQLMKSPAVAERYGQPRYVAHQVYYSLVGRDYEWELMPLGLDQGVGALV